MNRTILIVICDFLLVSLLAFSTVDINKVTDEGTPRNIRTEIVTNQVDSGKDLAAVMRLALDQEQKRRELLLGELTRSRDEVGRQQSLLTEREKQVQTFQNELRSREQQVQAVQTQLRSREQQVQTYQNEIQLREQQAQKLQQEQAALQQQIAASQTNISALNAQLHSSSVEALMSKEKLAAMEAEMKKRVEQSAALQQQLANLARSNETVLAERQQLAGKLQVAEVERRHATEQVAQMQDQVKTEREEKARLAEGVKVLATKSTALEKEIRENRPLAPNTIFNEFLTNRVEARVFASRSGLFGESTKSKDSETILVSDGTNAFALCHIQDTPLTLFNPGTEWEGLTGTLSREQATFPIRSLSFHLQDPRIVLMPVTQAEAKTLGCKVYRISADPFKFQDAVLVGAKEGYYGECKFEIDPTTPQYVRLDRSVIRGLFGKFNPNRGDLVFSKTGELLGVMANGSYCLMLQNFRPAATFQFSQDVRAQRTGDALARLYGHVSQLPFKLQ